MSSPPRNRPTGSEEEEQGLLNDETDSLESFSQWPRPLQPLIRQFSLRSKAFFWALAALSSFFIVLFFFALRSSYDETVILVSLDGFRADYFSRDLSKTLTQLSRDGVRAEYLKSCFPSITFPNHYSIVTGLYPEAHGIVSNVFYDPDLNETFVYTDPAKSSEGYWWGGEPIWITAVKQGKKAASCMYVGGNAEIKGYRPTYHRDYDSHVTLAEKVDTVLGWIDLPKRKRPVFIAMYIADVDSAGHQFGPGSAEVNDAIKRVDVALHQLVEGIRSRGLSHKVNIVVVSDHGMAQVQRDRVVYLDDYIDPDLVRVENNGPILTLEPLDASDQGRIYRTLKKAASEDGFWNIWHREDVPAEYHYSNNKRIGSLVLVGDVGSLFTFRDKQHASTIPQGAHGYNNSAPEMHAIFVASGPSFKPFKSREPHPPFSNVEIYNIIARILRLDPAPNNGTKGGAHPSAYLL
ncbi:alkaline-phosphatase-like protein [Polychytrium aggregatum]|uniref:alkaline-phosphatase-like protein n=1 Tax=Polychytrium aggregatum TaxID=110093 RepID=UPI0022FEE23D|nr:alkaline-phosphatase-like protein [Polychytrium aggregatum]KAI9202765.1 alkaline-phosphatase-like protein [Polychytrium aggregatum]